MWLTSIDECWCCSQDVCWTQLDHFVVINTKELINCLLRTCSLRQLLGLHSMSFPLWGRNHTLLSNGSCNFMGLTVLLCGWGVKPVGNGTNHRKWTSIRLHKYVWPSTCVVEWCYCLAFAVKCWHHHKRIKRSLKHNWHVASDIFMIQLLHTFSQILLA